MKIDEATGQVVSNQAKSISAWNKLKKSHSFNPQNSITPESAETRAIERVGQRFPNNGMGIGNGRATNLSTQN